MSRLLKLNKMIYYFESSDKTPRDYELLLKSQQEYNEISLRVHIRQKKIYKILHE